MISRILIFLLCILVFFSLEYILLRALSKHMVMHIHNTPPRADMRDGKQYLIGPGGQYDYSNQYNYRTSFPQYDTTAPGDI